MALKSVLIVLQFILILNCTVRTDKGPSLTALADSPSIDHQELKNNNTTWTHVGLPSQVRTIILDGNWSENPIEGSSITIKALKWPDYIMSVINTIRSPISVLIPIAYYTLTQVSLLQ